MPTVLRLGAYRFFFFSNDISEPIHIHIESGDKYAKFWLEPVQLASSNGFDARELTAIRKLIIENGDILRGKWDEYFGNAG